MLILDGLNLALRVTATEFATVKSRLPIHCSALLAIWCHSVMAARTHNSPGILVPEHFLYFKISFAPCLLPPPRCQSGAEILPKTSRAPCGNLPPTTPSKPGGPEYPARTQPRLAHLTAVSLTPAGFSKQWEASEPPSQLCSLSAQTLKQAPRLPAAALSTCSLRGQLVHDWSFTPGWHRERVGAWPAPFPRTTQPAGLYCCSPEL